MYVCVCKGISEARVQRLGAAGHVAAEPLINALGLRDADCCGRCELEIDEFVGPLDDWSQRMLVTVTRARAWDQARELWDLRHDPRDFEQARRTMDRAASLLAEWAIVGDRLVTGTGNGWRRLRKVLGRGERVATRL